MFEGHLYLLLITKSGVINGILCTVNLPYIRGLHTAQKYNVNYFLID